MVRAYSAVLLCIDPARSLTRGRQPRFQKFSATCSRNVQVTNAPQRSARQWKFAPSSALGGTVSYRQVRRVLSVRQQRWKPRLPDGKELDGLFVWTDQIRRNYLPDWGTRRAAGWLLCLLTRLETREREISLTTLFNQCPAIRATLH